MLQTPLSAGNAASSPAISHWRSRSTCQWSQSIHSQVASKAPARAAQGPHSQPAVPASTACSTSTSIQRHANITNPQLAWRDDKR